MKISVPGTDGRFLCLKKLLIGMGHEIDDDSPEVIITNFPYKSPLPMGTAVAACGPMNAPEGIFDLMKDEDYLADVAYMTAEGAVSAAMAKISRTIKGSRCLVIGWGRIGRALCELLHNMGSDVQVCTRRQDAWSEISEAGGLPGLTGDISSYIGGCDVIFSTPPAPVLGRNELSCVRSDAVIIDLASPPYGVDLEIAREMGIDAWREPALPGRYCPENAARAILTSLKRGGIISG